MRVSGQTIAAQKLQIVELLTHTLDGLGRVMAAVHEELTHYLSATVALLIQIDFAVFHAEHAKLGHAVADAHLGQDVVHQIGMQRIARGKMSYVLSWHSTLPNGSPGLRNQIWKVSANVGPDFSLFAV